MVPAASVSGITLAHPESRSFDVGRIDRVQVEDYARRRGMGLAEMEHWLAPNPGLRSAIAARPARPHAK
jgi:5-methyltetrahydrofolate--homocysteine methyltransferase